MISVVLSTHEVNGHIALVAEASTHERAVELAEKLRTRAAGKKLSTHSNVFENTRQVKRYIQARNKGKSHVEALKEMK